MTMTTKKLIGLLLLSVFLPVKNATALVVSPHPSAVRTNSKIKHSNDNEHNLLEKQAVARIRSTRTCDLDQVSDLLASALVGHDDSSSSHNFRFKMEQLKTKAAVQSNLGLRVRAMEEGKRFLSSRQTLVPTATTTTPDNEEETTTALLELDDPNHLRYLWSKDSFRRKVQQAAKHSNEAHPWRYHNFATVPEDPCWLQHAALVAEDIETEDIIGFCEIAMLMCPSYSSTNYDYVNYDNDDELCSLSDCNPTIANLVVSPKWRRRGVAKGLVKSAERFVQRKWQSDELGLYVEKRNRRALELYQSAGYQIITTSAAAEDSSSSSDQWYMIKQLIKGATANEASSSRKEMTFA